MTISDVTTTVKYTCASLQQADGETTVEVSLHPFVSLSSREWEFADTEFKILR